MRLLFDHYSQHPELIPGGSDGDAAGHRGASPEAVEQQVVDYIAGMTDRYCIARLKELAIPEESKL